MVGGSGTRIPAFSLGKGSLKKPTNNLEYLTQFQGHHTNPRLNRGPVTPATNQVLRPQNTTAS